MKIKATYYGANGWLIEFDNTRILIDPWLNGDLTFPPGDWLIKGQLSKEIEVPLDIDILLLTQGQPDHAHPPTLKKIKKDIHVIASEAASKIVRKMGFKKINTLKPSETLKHKNLNIQATSGASVPNIENGYIIDSGVYSIYIEPHGFLDKTIKPRNIDLLITPVIDFSLPLAGKFIKGKTVLPQLLKLFNPSTVMVSTTGGDISFTGIINNFIKVDGSVEDINIIKNNTTRLINPEPLKVYEFAKK
tara:strand:+ start:174 stop:914 length:741 start_codon:yes stop_codon:yes gene_type:complete